MILATMYAHRLKIRGSWLANGPIAPTGGMLIRMQFVVSSMSVFLLAVCDDQALVELIDSLDRLYVV